MRIRAAYPAIVVLALYCMWLGTLELTGARVQDFVGASPQFLQRSNVSQTISSHARDFRARQGGGYDGQFYYFIAVDPPRARYYIDVPAYRYSRILYPMTARALALGDAGRVPYTLILVNLAAMVLGTAALGLWLCRRQVSPWWALVYGLYPGLNVAMHRDLTEPLAYALVAVAVCVLDSRETRALLFGGLLLGLSVLARETTIVFGAVYGILFMASAARREAGADFARSSWTMAAAFAALVIVPDLLYRLFLARWLGSPGLSGGGSFELIPLRGLFAHQPFYGDYTVQLISVVVPSLYVGLAAFWVYRFHRGNPLAWALYLNILLFILWLPFHSYDDYFASGRITTGVLLATILCIPDMWSKLRRATRLMFQAALLWFSVAPQIYAGVRPTPFLPVLTVTLVVLYDVASSRYVIALFRSLRFRHIAS